jgi:chromate reductase, NAD(P)H dehydrogenase (quinone)
MSSTATKVLGISGSLRKSSCNTGLLRKLQAIARAEHNDVRFEIADLSDLPLYNQDADPTSNKELNGVWPASVAKLREQVIDADVIVFANPEYNYSVSSVLKTAIDWASRTENDVQPFAGKPASIVGAGGGKGGGRAAYHLRQIFVFLDVYALNKPEVQINIWGGQFFDSATGDVVDDKIEGYLRAHLAALLTFSARIQQ